MCTWLLFFFFKQKTAYEMVISDWSSDVCSSDLRSRGGWQDGRRGGAPLRCGRREPARLGAPGPGSAPAQGAPVRHQGVVRAGDTHPGALRGAGDRKSVV